MIARLQLFTCLLLFAANLLAQDSAKTKSGTIVISKSRSEVIEEKWPIYDAVPLMTMEEPVVASQTMTIGGYSSRANAYDRRYQTVSEFRVVVTDPNGSQTFDCKNKLATAEIQNAITTLQKTGGTASFQAIKTIRDSGKTVTLPGFTYTVNKSR